MNSWEQYEIGAIAHYYYQPPIDDSTAQQWSCACVSPTTTLSDLLSWADRDGIENMRRLEITVRKVGAASGCICVASGQWHDRGCPMYSGSPQPATKEPPI